FFSRAPALPSSRKLMSGWRGLAHGRSFGHALVPRGKQRVARTPVPVGEPEIEIAEHTGGADGADIEIAAPGTRPGLEHGQPAEDLALLPFDPVGPAQRFRPDSELVAAQHGGVEHAVGQGLAAQRRKTLRAGGGKELLAPMQRVDKLTD